MESAFKTLGSSWRKSILRVASVRLRINVDVMGGLRDRLTSGLSAELVTLFQTVSYPKLLCKSCETGLASIKGNLHSDNKSTLNCWKKCPGSKF